MHAFIIAHLLEKKYRQLPLLTRHPPSRSHPLQQTAWAAVILSRSFLCRSCFSRHLPLPTTLSPPPSQHTACAAALLSRSFFCRSCFSRHLPLPTTLSPRPLSTQHVQQPYYPGPSSAVVASAGTSPSPQPFPPALSAHSLRSSLTIPILPLSQLLQEVLGI